MVEAPSSVTGPVSHDFHDIEGFDLRNIVVTARHFDRGKIRAQLQCALPRRLADQFTDFPPYQHSRYFELQQGLLQIFPQACSRLLHGFG